MEKIRIGVLGAGRGEMMMKYCEHADNAELVAVCDQNELFLNRVRDRLNDPRVRFYTDFGQFLAHDMDAVVLANYATEHAPFAIRCLEAGKHVLSEVLPCQTLSEAVALAEAVEKSGRVYAYSENYCFMPAPREMRRLYRAGKLGEFEYGEGEYLHNCEPIWPEITQGRPEHWRNNIPATFYCTHSVGPLLHITGLRPVRVTGFELPYNARCARMGAKAGLPDFYTRFADLIPYWRAASKDGGLYKWESATPRTVDTEIPHFDIMVRSDVLEHYGWPNLVTASDWKAFLAKAVKDFPTSYDGQSTVGLTTPLAESWGMQGVAAIGYEKGDTYVAAGNDYYTYNDKTQQFEDYLLNPEAKESFQFFNDLYKEGLLDEECFTDTSDNTLAKMSDGRAIAVWYMSWNGCWM